MMLVLNPSGKEKSFFGGGGFGERGTFLGIPPARARVEKFDAHAGDGSRRGRTNTVIGSE